MYQVERGAGLECAIQIEGGVVEIQRRMIGDDVVFGQFVRLHTPFNVVDDRFVRNHHTLGHTGRSGREQHVGDIDGQVFRGKRRHVLRLEPADIEQERPPSSDNQLLKHDLAFIVDNHHACLRGVENQLHALSRRFEVNWHVGTIGLQDTENGKDRADALFQEKGHELTAGDAGRLKVARKRIGERLDFTETQRIVRAADRRLVRKSCGGIAEILLYQPEHVSLFESSVSLL